MTLNELKYVVTLADEKHFGRAAEKCFVSQPTLSIAVKKFEKELAVSLFERTRNQVSLTPVGERIVQQARRVLSESSAIKEIASAGQSELTSPLRVGAILTVGPYLFPHCIPILLDFAPEMPLVIEENYTASLRKQLKNGEIDVAIVALPFSENDIIVEPLYDENFVVLLPVGHELLQQPELSASDLEGQQFLFLGEGHCFRDQVIAVDPIISQAFEQRHKSVVAGESASIETLKHMVVSGLGITVLPASAADLGFYQKGILETRPFKPPHPSRTIALVYRASYTRPQAIQMLKKAILQCPLTPNS